MKYEEFIKKLNELYEKYGPLFKPKEYLILCDFRETIDQKDFDQEEKP